MIPLYEDGRRAKRRLHTFNGLNLNDPDDDPTDTFEVNSASMVGRYSTATEQHPQDDGSEVNAVYRDMYVLRLDITVRAPTYAKLYDKFHSLAVAFDPALGSLTSPSTNGVLPYSFDVPTEDTVNYPGGIVPSYYSIRARGVPIPPDSMFTGLSAQTSIIAEVPDPRRYLSAVSTTGIIASPATIDNSLATYQSWPSLSVHASGAGSATYTIARSAVGNYAAPAALVLDLSGMTIGQTLLVDMATQRLSIAGVDATSLRVSGNYFPIVPGSQTITLTNTTNTTSIITYHRAFVA